jgi:threonine 3-dehydrogenase
LGLPAKPVALDLPNDIIFKGAKVLGINGRRMFETWYQVENFVLTGRLDLDPIITHQLDLEDYEDGFRLMQSGEAIKVVLRVPQEKNFASTTNTVATQAQPACL